MERLYSNSVEIVEKIQGISKIKETLKYGGWAFFDIDGTLEDANGIPSNLNTYLQTLKLHGTEIGISTSRCHAEFAKFLNKMGDLPRQIFSGWSLLEDTHVISRPEEAATQFTVLTNPETLCEMKKIEAVFKSNWVPSENITSWGFLNDIPMPPVKLAPYPYNGSVCIWEKGPYEDPNYAKITAWAVNVALSLGITTIDFQEVGDGTLRLLQKGINKGTGLKMLSEKGLIDLSRTVYFGDANNDLPAAEVVLSGGGAVVALANSTQSFKNIASHTTEQPAGLGVIEVIKKLY